MEWRDLLGDSPQAPAKAPLVVDIETVGTPFDGRVVMVGWQMLGTLPQAALYENVPDTVWAMMADPLRPLVSHSRYDARFLRLIGREVTGPYFDTMVMPWVLDENQQLGIEPLVKRYLGVEMDKRIKRIENRVLFKQDDGMQVPLDETPLDQLHRYNLDDVRQDHDLFVHLWNRLEEAGWLYYWLNEEVPFTEVLLDMECRGLPVDLDESGKLRDELEIEHAAMESELLASGSLPPGFNVNSDAQLREFIFNEECGVTASLPCIPGEYNGLSEDEKRETAQLLLDDVIGDWPENLLAMLAGRPSLRFDVEKVGRSIIHGNWYFPGLGLHVGDLTDKGLASTSKGAFKTNIETASNQWVKDLLEFRTVDTLLTTYLRKWPKVAVNGRLYGHFNQTGTKTGRLSSSEPNLQNIPQRGKFGPRVRELFKP